MTRARLGATHLIVSDCRRIAAPTADEEAVVYVRPAMNGAGSWQSPPGSLTENVACGEAAVTPEILSRIRRWSADRQIAS